MPLAVDISIINAIEGKALPYDDLNATDSVNWSAPPPDILEPFQYHRCRCSGPSSGFEITIKYGGLICRIDVTAWGITYRKSTPTKYNLEVVLVKNEAPYRLELILT